MNLGGHFPVNWYKVDNYVVYDNTVTDRVATDLENLEKSGNLKESSISQGIRQKSQGICNRIPKVREKSGNFVV